VCSGYPQAVAYLELPGRGIDIYFEERGAGAAAVLLGGIASTAETWGLQVDALARHFRVITPDNRGSGRTKIHDDDGVRNPPQMADDVFALVDALGIDRFHLVGWSMGSAIAQAYAVSYPRRLRSLTLLSATPGGSHGMPGAPDVARAIFVGSVPGASEDDVAALAAAMMHGDTLEQNHSASEYFTATRRAHPHAPEELQRRVAGIVNFTVWDQLAELRVPTLIATGAGDRLMPPENSERLAQQIPGAELQLVERGGHVFFVEQPDVVNAMLIDFLQRH
jgi:3-oxoadipate enol-lactonase